MLPDSRLADRLVHVADTGCAAAAGRTGRCAPRHRVARVDVLGAACSMKPSGAMTGTLPLLHVRLVDDAAHAAEVIGVRMRVDHGDYRALAELLVDQSQRRGRRLLRVSGSNTIQPVSPLMKLMLERSKPRT